MGLLPLVEHKINKDQAYPMTVSLSEKLHHFIILCRQLQCPQGPFRAAREERELCVRVQKHSYQKNKKGGGETPFKRYSMQRHSRLVHWAFRTGEKEGIINYGAKLSPDDWGNDGAP